MMSECSFFVFIFLVSLTASKRFPSYIDRCHQSDLDVSLCYKRAFDSAKKHFTRGIPEFSFPPLNPLVLPQISLDDRNSFKATFNNVKIYNLDLMEAQSVVFNLQDNQGLIKVRFPKLRITSEYNIQGKILFLQLNGNGPADGNLTDVTAELTLTAERYKRGNKQYFKFSSLEVEESVRDAVFRFEGLFRDNPELTEQTNRVVNENIQEILKELRPATHVAIRQTVLGLIARMFEKFSVEELFPE